MAQIGFGLRGAYKTAGLYRESNWNWSYNPMSRRVAGFKALMEIYFLHELYNISLPVQSSERKNAHTIPSAECYTVLSGKQLPTFRGILWCHIFKIAAAKTLSLGRMCSLLYWPWVTNINFCSDQEGRSVTGKTVVAVRCRKFVAAVLLAPSFLSACQHLEKYLQ